MKRILLLFALGLGITLFFMSNETGALPENTGAPGEFTCGRAPCHNIAANVGNAQIAIVTTDGKINYFADSTLELKVSITNPLTAKNGFQILALNENRQNVGTWILTEPSKMKIINGIGLPNRFYVTHTAAGNRQTEWIVSWKAPGTNVGKVTFYASVLASNESGTNQGDQLYTTSLSLAFSLSTPTEEIPYEQFIRIYPTLASDLLFVENLLDLDDLPTALIDSKGVTYWLKPLQKGRNELDISDLPGGIYFLRLAYLGIPITRKIIIH
ncbi:MAG: choice-of-anchor V domain-containing protein [Saprospiraceae bacterium]